MLKKEIYIKTAAKIHIKNNPVHLIKLHLLFI